MKDLKILLIFLLCISCQGQEKNEKTASKQKAVVMLNKNIKNKTTVLK